MKNQLFKTLVDERLLWGFLTHNVNELEEYYILSKPLYKKAVFNNNINLFIQELDKFYHDSKKYYITRKLDYIKFITIIRQICNSLNIKYTTQFLYNNSSYEIVYYIYKSNISENKDNLSVN